MIDKYKLLVEGKDDEHVIRALCKRKRLCQTLSFEMSAKDGVVNLLDSISPEIKAPGRQAVGIVLDANDDINNRWQAITTRLKKANIRTSLDTFDPRGTIIHSRPRVGIWLMPDNRSPGELEDFVITMIPQGDSAWPHAKKYIQNIPNKQFKPNKEQRAQLYAWLATRKEPRTGMGSGINIGDLKVNGTLCNRFETWLKNLFR